MKTVTFTCWPVCPIDSADADLISRIIRAITDGTNFIPTELVDFWIRQILAGNEGAANALILASLPNIQNIEMLHGGFINSYPLESMVSAIADAQKVPTRFKALTRLSKITVEGFVYLLATVKALRRFLYSPKAGWNFSVQFICGELRKNAADTDKNC